MPDRFAIPGKTALVTGSSRGLGWAIAKGLAESGAHVVINARNADACAERVAELETAGHQASAAAFDAADFDAAKAAVAEIAGRRGGLDVLVNNAGMVHRQPLLEWSDADWLRMMDVNLNSCFVLAREAARGMVDRGWGRIINVGSVLSFVARPTIPGYVSTKHGLAGLTKALATEFGPKGVTANAICPGYFATELNVALKNDPEFNRLVTGRTPVGRWGEPDELAGLAIYLASNDAAYMNGAIIPIDGGIVAAMY